MSRQRQILVWFGFFGVGTALAVTGLILGGEVLNQPNSALRFVLVVVGALISSAGMILYVLPRNLKSRPHSAAESDPENRQLLRRLVNAVELIAGHLGSAEHATTKPKKEEEPGKSGLRRRSDVNNGGTTGTERRSSPSAQPAAPRSVSGPPQSNSRATSEAGGQAEKERDSSFVDSQSLTNAWLTYFRDGDGHFNAGGFSRVLADLSVRGRVLQGVDLGLGDQVLGVELGLRDDDVYLVPNFNYSPRALEEWFEDRGSGGRSARVRQLLQPARVRRSGQRVEVVQRGIVA